MKKVRKNVNRSDDHQDLYSVTLSYDTECDTDNKEKDEDDITLRTFILDFYTLILSKSEASSSKCISEIESFENKSDEKLMTEMMIFTKNYFSAAMNSLNHKGKPSVAVTRNWIKSNPR